MYTHRNLELYLPFETTIFSYSPTIFPSINLKCCCYFYSSKQAITLAEKYRAQWPGKETHPVNVSGNMEHYLTTKAKDMGLGDFNKKDLIAATFVKEDDKGCYYILRSFNFFFWH